MDVRLRLGAALVAAAWMLFGCGGGGGGGSPPPPPPPPPPVTLFGDVTATSGISFSHGVTPPGLLPAGPQSDIAASSFGGVASGDCDNDGDVDLFVTYSDQRANRLYINQRLPGGGFSFVDRASTSGAGLDFTVGGTQNGRHSGPVFVDLDGDGLLDLFLGALFDSDSVKVFRNTGNCNFADATAGSGLTSLTAFTTLSAGFGDYDLDGRLDMFLSHWGTPDSAYAGNRATASDQLWRNTSTLGNITFLNTSVVSGVTAITFQTRSWGPPPGPRCPRFVGNTPADVQLYDYIFTGSFAHLNGDAWPDLLLVGDFTTSQILLNNQDGTFSDASTPALCAAQQPMGSALGDIDHDGDLDWFTSSVRVTLQNGTAFLNSVGNRLFRNDFVGSGSFGVTDITAEPAVPRGGWGWGACMLDVDNDADLDIFHTNGWNLTVTDGPVVLENYNTDPSRIFINGGASFSEQGATYGLNDTLSGRGVVCADFDEDGDLDILQTTNRQPNSGLVRENRTAASGRNFLKVKLQGLAPNTDAAGARIYVTAAGRTQMREVTVGSDNYTSQNPTVQHFGLGTDTQLNLRIVWPTRVGVPPTADTIINALTPVNRTLTCNQATPTVCS